MDIKSGSLAAGIFQVILIIYIMLRSTTLDTLWSLFFIICPTINFYHFYRWVKKDTLLTRKKFYLSLTLTYMLYLLMWITLITLMEVYASKNDRCPISRWSVKNTHSNCEENFLILECCLELPFSAFQIYLIILVRQNYINKRDGAGEVNTLDQTRDLILQQEELMNQSVSYSQVKELKGSV